MIDHAAERPYLCGRCTETFHVATQLSSHLQKEHDFSIHPSLIHMNKPCPKPLS
jgi:hypothetical protein